MRGTLEKKNHPKISTRSRACPQALGLSVAITFCPSLGFFFLVKGGWRRNLEKQAAHKPQIASTGLGRHTVLSL